MTWNYWTKVSTFHHCSKMTDYFSNSVILAQPQRIHQKVCEPAQQPSCQYAAVALSGQNIWSMCYSSLAFMCKFHSSPFYAVNIELCICCDFAIQSDTRLASASLVWSTLWALQTAYCTTTSMEVSPPAHWVWLIMQRRKKGRLFLVVEDKM